ncbi:hypothetical protein ES319_A11G289500v1 [Gossypium barbadense]|uniref:eIF3a PCI domain-containing protein n=1 Tax=Gossypium barbadense TaxID=3634 RepID=A0A5J5TXY8_GOSBA|nr:hypothetical protein ES319_A11G289500v1 [Gossypium barbadense]
MANFAKPENALKRAEELINQKPLERIMFKYVELCVDMRKGRFAKDGLIQYRIVFQQVNVSSLEEVIKHFMHLSTEKAEQARTQAQALEEALDVDDLVFGIKIAGSLEAFRSVEDIHGLMSIVKKTTKASLMVVYYAKLTEIFWISGSHVYHGYAWLKLFTLHKSFNKNLSQKDLQLIASSVILAALSVLPLNKYMFSRSLLLTELVSKGVLNCATQEVKDLYHLLEHDFLPLDSASKIQPLLLKISKLGGKLASASSVPEVQLSKYVPALEKLTLRLLKQMSHKISVDAVKHKFIAMKVDHVKGVVLFGNMRLESDKLHDHLTLFAESLNKARAMIYPSTKKASKLSEVLPGLEEIVDKEDKRLPARKSIIEKRKNKNECEEESKRQMLQKKTEEAEKKRLAAVFEQQRAERIHKEIEERELEEAQALLQETEKHLKRGKRKPILEGEKLTKQALLEQAMSLQLKERQEQEKRLQKLEVELSRQHHDGDLKEKSRLARMLENKMIFHERVISQKERLRREALLGRSTEGQPSEPLAGSRITEPGNAAPATRKYVPRFRQQRLESSGPPTSSEPDRRAAGSRAPPPQSDRWSSGSRAPVQDSDRFGTP